MNNIFKLYNSITRDNLHVYYWMKKKSFLSGKEQVYKVIPVPMRRDKVELHDYDRIKMAKKQRKHIHPDETRVKVARKGVYDELDLIDCDDNISARILHFEDGKFILDRIDIYE